MGVFEQTEAANDFLHWIFAKRWNAYDKCGLFASLTASLKTDKMKRKKKCRECSSKLNKMKRKKKCRECSSKLIMVHRFDSDFVKCLSCGANYKQID